MLFGVAVVLVALAGTGVDWGGIRCIGPARRSRSKNGVHSTKGDLDGAMSCLVTGELLCSVIGHRNTGASGCHSDDLCRGCRRTDPIQAFTGDDLSSHIRQRTLAR